MRGIEEKDVETAPAGSLSAARWPPPSEAWHTVAVLTVVYTIAELDRGIITLLVEPIKRDLAISDVQMSYLLGFAFVFFYIVVGVPLSRLVDIGNRKRIIMAGLATWSFMTAMCGLAQSYIQLFLFRVGVGAGEAINTPASYSMISDSFPKERVPRAMAVLHLGFVAGGGLALVIGGLMIHLLESISAVHLPFGLVIRNWQLVFLVVGLPGLVLTLWVRTIKEPPRIGASESVGVRAPTLPQVLAFIAKNRVVYAPMFLGLAFGATLAAGGAAWRPVFFQRTYGWSAADVGMIVGTVNLIAGPLGLFAGAWLAEWHYKRGRNDANIRVVLTAWGAQIPLTILTPLSPNPWVALALGSLISFTGLMGAPGAQAALQAITPNRMRGQVAALYLFMFTVIGGGLGPTLVAVLTEHVFGDGNLIRYSLSLTGAILAPLCALSLWIALKPYGQAVTEVRRREEGDGGGAP